MSTTGGITSTIIQNSDAIRVNSRPSFEQEWLLSGRSHKQPSLERIQVYFTSVTSFDATGKFQCINFSKLFLRMVMVISVWESIWKYTLLYSTVWLVTRNLSKTRKNWRVIMTIRSITNLPSIVWPHEHQHIHHLQQYATTNWKSITWFKNCWEFSTVAVKNTRAHARTHTHTTYISKETRKPVSYVPQNSYLDW